MMASMPRDTSTRFEGVYARHRQACAITTTDTCTCTPSYWGKAYDRARGKPVKTTMLPSATAAKSARADLQRSLAAGQAPMSASPRLEDAADEFIAGATRGSIFTKHGKPYKPNAVRDLEGCLRVHVIPHIGARTRLADIRRRDIQELVDLHATTMSGSRIRSIVNAVRALYRWAELREIVEHNPAARVQLPAVNATVRSRVATPAELDAMLTVLPLADALPHAVAAYTGARLDEIRHITIADVDLDLGVIYLGHDPRARKSKAAQRAVPLVPPIRALIRRSLLERGRPGRGDELLCPARKPGGRNRGLMSGEALRTRSADACKEQGVTYFRPHELRHTCATWLDAAGVRPVVASIWMGHSAPAVQAGAAAITQQRYTHALPGDFELARDLLARWLTAGHTITRGALGVS